MNCHKKCDDNSKFFDTVITKKALGFVEGQTGSTEMGLDSSVKGSEMPKMRL